jgi:hypothetical protein
MDDPACVAKVTLIEGIPFEKEIAVLPYPKTKFTGLFRNTKMNPLGVQNYTTNNGFPSHLPSSRSSSLYSLKGNSPDLGKVSMNLTRSSTPAVKSPMNWAAKAAAPPLPSPITAPAKPVPEVYKLEETIQRNRAGQRVDPPTCKYDKAEVERIKKIKMCNVHFLKKECPYDEACTHL